MLLPVLHGDHQIRRHIQSGFLPDFLDHIFQHGQIHIHPTARQGPGAVLLLYQQDPVIPEDGCPGIQLRSLVAGFTAEQTLYLSKGISPWWAIIWAAMLRISAYRSRSKGSFP